MRGILIFVSIPFIIFEKGMSQKIVRGIFRFVSKFFFNI